MPNESDMPENEAYRILIADHEWLQSEPLKVALEAKGFSVIHVRNLEELTAQAAQFKPHFLLIHIVFPELNGLQAVNWVNEQPTLRRKTQVIVVGAHSTLANVKAAIKVGAVDYWVKPIDLDQVASRLVFHISRHKSSTEGSGSDANVFLEGAGKQFHLTDLLFREAQKYRLAEDSIFNVTRMIAWNLKCVRVSVVACMDNMENGWVVASSDERNVSGLKLALPRYPEISHVLLTDAMVVIDNMDYDPRLQEIKQEVKSITFNAMILFPIHRRGQLFGVLSCRQGIEHRSFHADQIRFVRLAAIAAGFILERDDRQAPDYARKSAA